MRLPKRQLPIVKPLPPPRRALRRRVRPATRNPLTPRGQAGARTIAPFRQVT